MTRTVVTIGGTKYYTVKVASKIFGVSHQTLYRWAEKAEEGCGGVLAGLRFFRDPVNGFHYFTAASVEKVKKAIIDGRRVNGEGVKCTSRRKARR